ncbi:outer membrane beta-barrel protein, partial [Bradyrhizobium sp. UBA2491]
KPKPPPGPGSPAPTPPPVTPTGDLRLSIPPSTTANKTPLPPAMAGTIVGQPPRKRLKIDDDPFGAVGDYAGSFLIKTAVEVMGGYDSNPGRLNSPQGRGLYVVAPEFLAVSDWERHAIVADLRGSFTGYGSGLSPNADGTPLSAPLDVDRPSFTGHIDGRLDVSRDTHLTAQARLLVSTDN